MNVAFSIKPLLDENRTRGIGHYTTSMLMALRRKTTNSFRLLEFTEKVPKEADVVHYPFFEPFFLTLPFIKNKPTIVTIHDLIPLKFPRYFRRGIRGEIKWQLQKISLQSCPALITDSKCSKKDLIAVAGLPIEKISVIPLAAEEVFRPFNRKTVLKSIRQKYHLPQNFLLYVGDVNWNKNIAGLLGAFAQIRKQGNSKQSGLVLVGNSFLLTELEETRKINNLIKRIGKEESVIKLGFVPKEDLAAIYNLATCYIQPSFYEGFGLPVLEAMASGCPVICARSGSLMEVAGDAVVYVDPYDIRDIAGRIAWIMENGEIRDKMREKGLKRAKKFSWEKTAQDTIAVYEKVSKSNK